jgi:hypothetical protein
LRPILGFHGEFASPLRALGFGQAGRSAFVRKSRTFHAVREPLERYSEGGCPPPETLLARRTTCRTLCVNLRFNLCFTERSSCFSWCAGSRAVAETGRSRRRGQVTRYLQWLRVVVHALSRQRAKAATRRRTGIAMGMAIRSEAAPTRAKDAEVPAAQRRGFTHPRLNSRATASVRRLREP